MDKNKFGADVLGDAELKTLLPNDLYDKLKIGMDCEIELSENELDICAEAMRKWATSKGATKYTHWFTPLNNCSAGKRNSFFCVNAEGTLSEKFRGKELYFGEGDASSFPNGGIRQTFEAKGVTRWDYTSHAFVKDNCLYIPCSFAGFGGESLDKKTPLIRSCRALNMQGKRLLAALGLSADSVASVIGAEQEYFLLDKNVAEQRSDLAACGRTLFGAKPAKCQQLQDHYFGITKQQILKFMEDVDERLLKLGILARTEHNEVAPCQFELVPCYERVTIASDQNQLVMQILQETADEHGLTCLLHEKPFAYVNGSGKHNNWSVITDGRNVFDWTNVTESGVFALFFAAVIKGVDEYQDLLRASVSSPSNAKRLGGMEAPTDIVSVFVGDQLWNTMKDIGTRFTLGTDVLPNPPHSTDRNRTSPFAYTGNKFEMRMVGSSACLADVNTVINTVMAESLRVFADELSVAEDPWKKATDIVAETLNKHSRIVYNGNCYDQNWKNEAKQRHLFSADDIDCAEVLTSDKNVALFANHNVMNKRELQARKDVLKENYFATTEIEARAALSMFKKEILPTATNRLTELLQLVVCCKTQFLPTEMIEKQAKEMSEIIDDCLRIDDELTVLLDNPNTLDKSVVCRNISAKTDRLRQKADKLEDLCPSNKLPYPTYEKMLLGK